jgi:hypothetical protein
VPDATATWEAPAGYTLTILPGHYLNEKGFAVTADSQGQRRIPYQDGAMDVFWFNEAEPFVWTENDGRGVNASQAAKDAAAAGKPMAGYSPNGEYKPIAQGYVPPVYVLTKDDDDTPAVEPHERA